MRVVMATDRIGPFSSREAGEALAVGWQRRRPEDQLAVVPMGSAAAGLTEAYADLAGVEVGRAAAASSGGTGDDVLLVEVCGPGVVLVGVEGRPVDLLDDPDPRGSATSAPWGQAIARILAERDGQAAAAGIDTLVVDLGGCAARDGGAGLLAALGAVADAPLDHGGAGLEGLSRVDLAAVRTRLGGVRDLVAVVPADQADRQLLGLRGITSLHGAALREAGLPWDPGELLAADATLDAYARTVAAELADLPGAGACGGAAFALAALGARLVTGPQWLAEWSRLGDTLGRADLVVTGSTAYDFAQRGGETVEAVVSLAGVALRPVVAVAGVVTISPREMRSHGVDAAYAVHRGAPPGAPVVIDADDLRALGERLARTWSR